ncbi:aldo/keto reductase [Deinococcus hopiensis]|uniref:Predicted oxidoreductase n=1 Tax=Deinococcus hopiensis KR-140 TaxID=695939 RepID=A0A1W1UUL6_9DEIO|nr:aldo/keto reductase [Deinococcus hopiensis]SMB84763.1 Predicted oxidoreductase [Deinococcus hopiensis KR-140]
MKQRPLGTTGLHVSELGLGAWQLANPSWGVPEGRDAQAIVRAALEEGCTFFDTAPGYSAGRSEETLGAVLKPVRSEVVLCSKFGHTADGRTNFDVGALQSALQQSLERLQTDYLDVYLLHNPPAALLDGNVTPLYEELEQLKSEGRIRAYGVSIDSRAEIEMVLRTTNSTVLEVLFNAFHQEPAGAFEEAGAKGVGLVVKVPLDSGWLSGKYGAHSRFEGIRGRWTPDVIARRAALVEQLTALVPEGHSLLHAALQFILSQRHISTVIAGAKDEQQLRENMAASRKTLPEEVVQNIQALWKRELKDAPLPW